jgi:hypothetical protein
VPFLFLVTCGFAGRKKTISHCQKVHTVKYLTPKSKGTPRRTAEEDGVPPSLQILPHTASYTHTLRSLACPLLTLSSVRPFSNCIFTGENLEKTK